MAITITTPAQNNITVNETTQTVNVTNTTNTISVQTSGIATSPAATTFSALTDVSVTTPYGYGHLISVDNNLKLVSRATVATNVADNRPVFQYSASNAGSNSAIVLKKHYGATNFASGDGAGIRFEVDSDAQPSTEFAILHAQYGSSQPAFVFATSADNATTAYQNALVVRRDKTIVYGDLQVVGNTIYDSSNNNVIDFKEYSTIYGTAYQVKFNTDKTYGLAASYMFIDGIIEHNSSSLTTTNNSTYSVLDYWDKTVVRSAKYIIQISNGTDHQMWEGMVIHDGTNIRITGYGDIRTNGVNLATISAGFNATTGHPELRVQPVFSTSTKFKAAKTLIYV